MRCHLEVFSLADITTGDGTKIRPCFKYVIKGDTVSSWDWAEERPTRQDIQKLEMGYEPIGICNQQTT